MWVTVLASQPSVSIETVTTQRTCSPSLPFLPTVFITSRSRSSSVILSTSAPGLRWRYSALNASISAAAAFLKSSFSASPDSSWAESTRIVRGRASGLPSTTLLKQRELAGLVSDDLVVLDDLPRRRSSRRRACDTTVFGQTTMNTGGVSPCAASSVSQCANAFS